MTSLSPTTIGDESPPGTDIFHFTFLSGPTSTGGFWSSAIPDPLGPRNCGHTSGSFAKVAAAIAITNVTQTNFIMLIYLSVWVASLARRVPCFRLQGGSMLRPAQTCLPASRESMPPIILFFSRSAIVTLPVSRSTRRSFPPCGDSTNLTATKTHPPAPTAAECPEQKTLLPAMTRPAA